MPIHESGHAKLVSRFEDLYRHCLEYGALYNPGYPALQVSTLSTRLDNARSAIVAVQFAKTAWVNAANDRVILFSGVKKLATRIIGALMACGAIQQRIDDAKAANRKLNGQRAGKLPATGETSRATPLVDPGTTPAPAPVGGTTQGPARHSVSHQSFDSIVENFAALVSIVAAESLYTPTEPDLQVSALNAFVEQLHEANAHVITYHVQYENARINRDKELYNLTTGISPLGQQVKNYIKSLFGAGSAQYKQVSGISFA